MQKQLNYKDISIKLLTQFKEKRQQLFKIKQNTSTIEDTIRILVLNKQYSIQYRDFIQKNRWLKNIFRKLRNFEQDISQSQYQKQIDSMIKTLIEKFQQKYQKRYQQSQKLNIVLEYFQKINQSIIKQSTITQTEISQSTIYSSRDYKQINQNQNEQQFLICNSFEDDFEVQSKDQQRLFKKQKQKQKIKIEKLNHKNLIPQKKSSNSNISNKFDTYHRKPKQPIQNEQIPQNQNSKPKASNHLQQIESTQLTIQIQQLDEGCDVQSYKYNGYSLQRQLKKLIIKYLQQNAIIVRRKTTQILLMEEQISYIKSADAGNYRFNPFCDAVKISIKFNQNKQFDYDFKVVGNIDNINVELKIFNLKQWDKNLFTLKPKSRIQDLIKYVCQKRQIKVEHFQKLVKALKNSGGAHIVQDLYSWQKNDYSKLNIQTTVIFQIIEVIQQIKDNSNIKNQYSMSQAKKNCLIKANSHKILRYVIYKLYGKQEVKKISWLNMQNLKNAIEIVKKEIYNQSLLDQLQDYFNQFALDPKKNPIQFSRGLVLYGPPGTGKTVLTQALPNIIGFHLIDKGLSAADFMKSLVGESSRMIRDLVNRASISPYLLCSIGIDQVDGLVPDRKDKDQKNKAQGISMLLSVIGGNKDVSNLVFMTSTNYLKKIDEAIRRRLSGQYMVGRPNPWQRCQIILKKLDQLKDNSNLLDHLIKITTNFTGAALKSLSNNLLKQLNVKEMNEQKIELSIEDVTRISILIARQFSITLGVYTVPQIYRDHMQKKFVFTQTFLKRISRHFLLIKHNKDNQFGILYCNQLKRFNVNKSKLQPYYEKQEDKINIPIEPINIQQGFQKYIRLTFSKKEYQIEFFKAQKDQKYKNYQNRIQKFLKLSSKNNKKKKLIILHKHQQEQGSIIFDLKLFQKNNRNFYIIFVLQPQISLKQYSDRCFGDWNQKKKNISNNFKQIQKNQNQIKYDGNIMVELNEQTRMAFKLKSKLQEQSKVVFRFFLRSEQNTCPKSVIPELVDFFTKQQASYILMITYELLLQNDAFDQKKILQVLQEKMMQAKNYQKVAVIIDLDSMITLNENFSDSNFGRTTSYSIQNHNLFQILLNYMKQFGMVTHNISRWMTVIVKHPQLIKIIKKQLDWPKYPEQIQKMKQQEQLDVKKRCYRCNQWYTQRDNKQQRKCSQHYGKIIDTVTRTFEDSPINRIKCKILKCKKQQKKDQNRYIYACCLKGIFQQGCSQYYHIDSQQFETQQDQLESQKINSLDKWDEVLQYFE